VGASRLRVKRGFIRPRRHVRYPSARAAVLQLFGLSFIYSACYTSVPEPLCVTIYVFCFLQQT